VIDPAVAATEAVHAATESGRPMTMPGTGDLVKTPAERSAHEEYERAEKRRLERAEQCSNLNPPDVRIRTWEKIHALRLPSDPAHPILDVIAISTRLTLEEVREEQRTRAARAAGMSRS
jgi:hypothetical protein